MNKVKLNVFFECAQSAIVTISINWRNVEGEPVFKKYYGRDLTAERDKMMKRFSTTVSSYVFLLIFALCPNMLWAQLPDPTGDIDVHDPVMIKQADTYYIFYTGNGVCVKSSRDMVTWKEEPPVFAETPQWVLDTIPNFRRSMWAPDIMYRDGRYYLYYSVSAFGRNTSAIGVATNTTLDYNDPAFKWIDQGKVVQSVPGRDMWNAIDPNVSIDEDGTPWMVFGSFWMGMKMVKLQPDMTRIVTDETQEWHTVAARAREFGLDEREAGDAAIEAPFIFKKNGYYYLFVSWDYCCRGANSNYKIMAGRSGNICGPYLDKDGNDLTCGGGTLVACGNDHWAGVGHEAAYTIDGKDLLVFHGYDSTDHGRSKLLIKEIEWDNDGWPEISL